jgi:hypothetical protein
MNILEAAKEGKIIGRVGSPLECLADKYSLLCITLEDLLAEDWQIVKPRPATITIDGAQFCLAWGKAVAASIECGGSLLVIYDQLRRELGLQAP